MDEPTEAQRTGGAGARPPLPDVSEVTEADLGPIATEVLFENDRVRVWENRLAPGERSAVHRHDLDYLIVDLEGDRIAADPLPGQDGRFASYVEAPVRTGQVIYLERGMTEVAANVGDRPYRTIIVELKD